MDDLKKDPAIVEWFRTIRPKPSTEKGYLAAMTFYIDFVKKSPTELLEEAEHDAEHVKLMRLRRIRRYLLDYIGYLSNLEISPNTAKFRLDTVKSFYKHSDVALRDLPKFEKEIEPLEENLSIPTKDDIIEALGVCDVLEKALMLVGVSSGLRTYPKNPAALKVIHAHAK